MADFVQYGRAHLLDDVIPGFADLLDVPFVDDHPIGADGHFLDAPLGQWDADIQAQKLARIIDAHLAAFAGGGRRLDVHDDVFQVLVGEIRQALDSLLHQAGELFVGEFHFNLQTVIAARAPLPIIDSIHEPAVGVLRMEVVVRSFFVRFSAPRRSPALWLAAALAVHLTSTFGCRAPSLLITPVSGDKSLEEKVLDSDSTFARSKVAMIDVSGTISNTAPFKLFGDADNPVSMLLEQLKEAERDRAVKAVILRINSPGGTVVASELMHDEIMNFRRRTGKPVIAMMMDVAASGGYYIACACDRIVAQPSTITGSIGVIMLTFDLSGTMYKLGARTDAIVSGPFKDAGSPFRAMNTQERSHFQGLIDDMYGRFVHVVAAGRPELEADAVKGLADGRVFTAHQAVELGLVDQIATPRETFEIAKKMSNTERAKLVSYARAYDWRPNYYAAHPAPSPGDVNFIKLDLPELLTPQAPQFMYLWTGALSASE